MMHCNQHLVYPIGHNLFVIKPARSHGTLYRIWDRRCQTFFFRCIVGDKNSELFRSITVQFPTVHERMFVIFVNRFDTHTTSIWHTCANRTKPPSTGTRLLWKEIDALTLNKQLVSFNHIWTVHFKRSPAADHSQIILNVHVVVLVKGLVCTMIGF